MMVVTDDVCCINSVLFEWHGEHQGSNGPKPQRRLQCVTYVCRYGALVCRLSLSAEPF